MHLTFDAARWSRESDGFWLRLRVTEAAAARAFLDAMRAGKRYAAELKEHREKRSLDANAYCWVLLDRLASALGRPKGELYREYIREIGGNCETVCVKDAAVDRLRSAWERNGIGWQTQTMPSKLAGCTCVLLYYGSSTYDSAQMARLIDLIVEDCRGQGIETLPPDKLDAMKERWADAPED